MKAVIFSVLLMFCITLAACSSRRIEKDMSNGEDPQIAAGRLVFKYNCQKCHPNGEAGVGPALNQLPLPRGLIKARVRSRAFMLYLGRMPQFSKHEISKQELSNLVAYMKYMEKDTEACFVG
jgi:mono/diheme cytochrome c family protein